VGIGKDKDKHEGGKVQIDPTKDGRTTAIEKKATREGEIGTGAAEQNSGQAICDRFVLRYQGGAVRPHLAIKEVVFKGREYTLARPGKPTSMLQYRFAGEIGWNVRLELHSHRFPILRHFLGIVW
jgi:hypothetical protein